MATLPGELVDVADAKSWHEWLRKHYLGRKEAWLFFHTKGSGVPTITYDEALDEALAFGWIDSVIKKVDDKSYVRKFTPRRPGSIWSTSNIGRVQRLSREGRMTERGLELFRQRSGRISMLEKVNAEGATIPRDFESALRKNRLAWSNFQQMAASHRTKYLVWIASAKGPTTRQKRISEAVLLVGKNVKNLLK